jgi:hypothetical protein
MLQDIAKGASKVLCSRGGFGNTCIAFHPGKTTNNMMSLSCQEDRQQDTGRFEYLPKAVCLSYKIGRPELEASTCKGRLHSHYIHRWTKAGKTEDLYLCLLLCGGPYHVPHLMSVHTNAGSVHS